MYNPFVAIYILCFMCVHRPRPLCCQPTCTASQHPYCSGEFIWAIVGFTWANDNSCDGELSHSAELVLGIDYCAMLYHHKDVHHHRTCAALQASRWPMLLTHAVRIQSI